MKNFSKSRYGVDITRWIKQHQWLILVCLAVVSLLLGYIGFSRSLDVASDSQMHPLDLIYLSLQLFTLKSGNIVPIIGWELQVARFLAPAVAFYSLILFLFVIFQQKIRKLFLRFARDHVVICGKNEISSSLSNNFYEAGYNVITIDSHEDNSGNITFPNQYGITIFGDPTDIRVLSGLSTENARYFFAVETDDGKNLEISARLPDLMKTSRSCPLYCFIHLNSPEMADVFREQQLFSEQNNNIRIEYFNVYQLAGWILIRDFSPFPRESSDIKPIHVLIAGLGKMGESVLIHIAKKWRTIGIDTRQKIVVSVIDKAAKSKISWITAKYPSLTDFVEIIPLEIEIKSLEFIEGKFLEKSDHVPPLTMIYCCFGDETFNIVASLELQKALTNLRIRKDDGSEIQIIARTTYDMGFNLIIKNNSGVLKKYQNIRLFPFIEKTCSLDFIFYSDFELIARAIHEEYLFLQLKEGRKMDQSDTDPDSPMKQWEELSEYLKASNREQAANIRKKLTRIGCEILPSTRWDEPLFEFTDEELEQLSIQEHSRWMEEKFQKGWKYGPLRNNDQKIHNCLISWNSLPESEKEKDREAVRSIPIILQKVDLRIRRLP